VDGLAANGDLDAVTASDRGGSLRSDTALADSARDGTAAGTGATRDDRGLDRGGFRTGTAGGVERAADLAAAAAAVAGGAGSLASRQGGTATDPRDAMSDRLDSRGDADVTHEGLTRGSGNGGTTAVADVRGAQESVESLSIRGAAGGGSLGGVRQQDRGSGRGSADEQVRCLPCALCLAVQVHPISSTVQRNLPLGILGITPHS